MSDFSLCFKLKEGTIVNGYITEEEEDDSDVDKDNNKNKVNTTNDKINSEDK